MAIFGTHTGKGHTAAFKEKTLASLLRQREAAIISRRGLKSSGPGCICSDAKEYSFPGAKFF